MAGNGKPGRAGWGERHQTTLRIPPEVHEFYLAAARQAGVSVNVYLNYALARFAGLPAPEECAVIVGGEQRQLAFTQDVEGAA